MSLFDVQFRLLSAQFLLIVQHVAVRYPIHNEIEEYRPGFLHLVRVLLLQHPLPSHVKAFREDAEVDHVEAGHSGVLCAEDDQATADGAILLDGGQ